MNTIVFSQEWVRKYWWNLLQQWLNAMQQFIERWKKNTVNHTDNFLHLHIKNICKFGEGKYRWNMCLQNKDKQTRHASGEYKSFIQSHLRVAGQQSQVEQREESGASSNPESGRHTVLSAKKWSALLFGWVPSGRTAPGQRNLEH